MTLTSPWTRARAPSRTSMPSSLVRMGLQASGDVYTMLLFTIFSEGSGQGEREGEGRDVPNRISMDNSHTLLRGIG